jgi:outer membrane lipoprotein-sorting protein
MDQISFRRFVVLVLFFETAFFSFAEQTALPLHPLAERVLKKYQTFQTYHARWAAEIPNATDNLRTYWGIAFERKTRRVLFSLITYRSGDSAVSPESFLLVSDGKAMTVASAGAGRPIEKHTIPLADPNELSYRDVRSRIPFFCPFDLALIMSPYPFMEIIQAQRMQFKYVSSDLPQKQAFEVTPDGGGASARFVVDPNSSLIQEFQLIHSPKSKIIFTKTSLEVDKRLPDDLFDFEKQLQQFEAVNIEEERQRSH